MDSGWRWLCSLFVFCALTNESWGGGSGLNVVVVVNQNSTNSVQLGNYYCEQRQVPPQNLLRVNWSGGNQAWDITAFATNLYNPLLAMLASRQLTNQIDYVLLSMDIPYIISNSTNVNNNNSTTSALFYGYKPDTTDPFTQGCSVAPGSTNLYAGAEGIFRSTPPISATSNSFLVCMVTSSNLALAKMIIDQGASSDGTFPTQTVDLAKSTDVDRNVRYQTFDNAVFNTRLRGNYSMQRTNLYGISGLGVLLGVQSGDRNYGVSDVSFVPGGLADNLTSYGGIILTDSGYHLSILSLLAAGASGSYGTVSEPCNYLEKFPSPQNYLYQARGFSLAECYYQSVTNPYQGLLLGEPLAAPFAQSSTGSWNTPPANSLLTGTTNLSLQFTASDSNHPIQQIDLFLDGAWMQTLTNLAPARSNLLNVTINGQSMNYSVPLNATIKTVASGLTSLLNLTANTNATKVLAYARGDRIELQSFDRTKTGAQVSLSVSNSMGTNAALTTRIAASRTNFLDTIAFGLHNLVVNSSTIYPPPSGAYLLLTITKTNNSVITVGSTNNSTTVTNIALCVSNLVNQVNANAQLSSADGCAAEDFIDYSVHVNPNDHGAEFNLRALTAGWNAAQIQASLTGSSASYFSITPTGAHPLQDNLPDLEPRNHLYISAGVTNLPLIFAFNTTPQANGFHELQAVAYEGTHVRTQGRVKQNIQIQNGALSATFTTLVGGTNSALEATLQFSVVANTNITKIELFSTGGSLGSVSGVSNALFSVAGTNLGLGLHPFYAIVTASSGKQYRTDTKWIRLVGADSPFGVSITAPPPTLTWQATAGRSYDILSTTNLTNNFQVRASIMPSNTSALWTETNASAPQRFYRVRTSN